MIKNYFSRTILALSLLSVMAIQISQADHNSIWGAGTANMPNDIHNVRIDTMNDNDSFIDFVRMGAGADSVNRFLDDVVSVARGSSRGGMGSTQAAARGGRR